MTVLRTHKLPLAIALMIVLLASFLFARSARAFEYIQNGVIGPNEVINDDVFLNADHVVMDGTVNGNLMVTGNSVDIHGAVNGDLLIFGANTVVDGEVKGNTFFAGQTGTFKGKIGSSLFAAGAQIFLEDGSHVNGNVYGFGFSLSLAPQAAIDRDLMAQASEVNIQGKIGRDLAGNINSLDVSGNILRNVNVVVAKPGAGSPNIMFYPGASGISRITSNPSGIRIAEGALVGGKLTYSSGVEQANTIHLPADQVVYIPINKEIQTTQTLQQKLAAWARHLIQDMVTMLILAGLAAWLFSGFSKKALAALQTRPFFSAAWGLLLLFGVPLLALAILVALVLVSLLIGIITLQGLSQAVLGLGLASLGFAATVFMIAVVYGSRLVVALVIGKLVLDTLHSPLSGHRFWPIAVGVVIYSLVISLHPVIGLLVGFFTILFGLGAIWLALRKPLASPAVDTPPVPG